MTTKRTVYVALAANLSIAIVKAIAGAVTGSSAMLAEAAHSVAGFNQVFLWLSLEFSERPPDPERRARSGSRSAATCARAGT